MNRFLLKTVFIAILFSLWPYIGLLNPKEAAAQESPVVNAIEISGLKRIEESAVRARVTQKTGEPLLYQKTSEDIKKIFEMGYFDDVTVDLESFEGGVKLIYRIKEKPVIGKVYIQGNKEKDEEKIREHITIATGSIADTVLINDNAGKIRSFYEEEGYPLANIVPILKKISEDEIILTYQIEEGPKVRIKKINITGNKALSASQIKKVMGTSEWWFLSFMTSGGYYKKAAVASDREKIKDLYLDNGFISAVVSDPAVELTEDNRYMDINIHVSEGEQFRISSVGITGNRKFTEKELRDKIKSGTGSVISKKIINKDVTAITEMYSEKGHATANIVPKFISDEKTKQVALAFEVEEGDIYKIGRIEISGNTRTRDKVIRREMLLAEGETFNSSLIRRSYERITNLNFFDSVNMQPRPRPEEKTVDVAIDVKERATGFISVGGGYSSVDKLIGMVDLTQGNLGGRGQYLKLRAELGGRSTFYEFSFKDPWFLDKPMSFTTSVYKTTRQYLNFDRKASGFEIGVGKRLMDYWRTNFVYNYERATIYNIKESASSSIKEQEGTKTTSSISPSIIRDSRDNYIDPHTGSRNELYLTYAGLGGDNKFLKGIIDSAWFFPVGETTFSIRGRYGHATGLSGEPLPLYERFYVGGIYTIRGLGYGEGGPRDENGEVIGGKKELIFNVEYTFPVLPSLKLKGVAFFDAGAAFDESIDKLRYTSGLGIRWISPIGPIRIEWGYNIDKKPGEQSSRWEFTFGSFF